MRKRAKHDTAGRARVARYPRVFVVAPAVLAGMLAGCGYAPGVRMGPDVRTVAVPTFENHTVPLRRDLEFELTSLVRRAIQERSSLTIVEDGVADVSVYGEIRDFNEYIVAEDQVDRALESVVTIVVLLQVEDYRSRTVAREVVSESEPLSITQGESLSAARRRALGGLARKILDHLQVYSPPPGTSQAPVE